MLSMELRHIKCFLTLAEELHFRKAAEKLFIAQPALTRQIKVLEEELGTLLFKRDKRNVSLTLAGQYLQREGYQLMKKVHQIETSIAEMGSMTGMINIGYIGSAMSSVLPSLLEEMGREFPKVQTHLVEDTTQNLLNGLLDGHIDILLGRPHRKIPYVHSEVVHVDKPVLVTAVNSRWKQDSKTNLGYFAEAPFILYPRSAGASFRDTLISACDKSGFQPMIKHETIHAYSILKLVEQDLGVSVLPESIARGHSLAIEYDELAALDMPLELVASYRTDVDHELPKVMLGMLNKSYLQSTGQSGKKNL